MKKINTESDDLVINLTDELLRDIALSRSDIKESRFLENRLLDKQVRQWLKVR
jgi:hypothetical protein